MLPDAAVVHWVIARELRAGARTFAAWWIPTAGLLALVCALQPSLADGLMTAKVQSMPEAMRRAFSVELVDFHRPVAYLSSNFLYVALSTGIFAARLGAGVIAKEEALHMAEMLYTQPVSRSAVLLGKAGAVAGYAVGFPVGLAAVALAVLAAVAQRPLEPGLIAAQFAAAAALGVCFGGLGMLVATLVRDARSAGGGALGVALGAWFVGALSGLAPAAAPLRWLSPYKIVEPSAITAGDLAAVRIAALVAIGVACGALAIARYRRRDIHA
jgi:ABC-2 type transport system permease protein